MNRECEVLSLERIAVIGAPGAGKSTLALRLGELLDLAAYHLDRLFWRPNWVRTPREEWEAVQQELVQQDSWIIDGNYGNTLRIRAEAADTIIDLDFPRLLCLMRVVRRTLSNSPRPDMTDGCDEKLDWEYLKFLWYVWTFPQRERPGMERVLNSIDTQNKQLFSFSSPQQVENWISTLAGAGS
jgi:adenylate kinase family enzyme